jgi:MoCo/4Fe-4S cofactor protein with predicted Tat translocation signal
MQPVPSLMKAPRLYKPARAIEFDALREAARSAQGAQRWRALEALADCDGFDAWLQREHPQWAAASAMNRRDFLRFSAASMALAGAAGCSRPPEEAIVPMRVAPDAVGGAGAGQPAFYATALSIDGYASGVLVESHDGRPTKIEGNPRHPASLGATDVYAQAAVLDVWDPDRSQTVLKQAAISTWDECLRELADAATRADANGGAGLRLLTGEIGSPSLLAQIGELQKRWPQMRHHVWQACSLDNVRAGARAAFGRSLEPVYRFDRAQIIVALDADFLGRMPGRVRYARDFADARRIEAGKPLQMNRLYAAEPDESLSGAMADHRLAVAARDIAALATAIAAKLGIGDEVLLADHEQQRWADAAAADLLAHRGHALLLAGESQPAEVHALTWAINDKLAAIGATVELIPVAMPARDSLPELIDDLNANHVDTLLMLDVNPAYDAPADLRFAQALSHARLSLHLGQYADETAQLSRWHVPQAHALESWSDARAYDGTLSLVQPLMQPLYGGRSAHELLAAMLGRVDANGYELLREHWKPRLADFDRGWGDSLRRGTIAAHAGDIEKVPVSAAISQISQMPAKQGDGLELVFRPDPNLWDGRYANNGWLQELPKPGSSLTWNNAVLISRELAGQLQLKNGDEVRLSLHGRSASGPVWISSAQAPHSVTVFLGGGRRSAGRIGNGVGFDANALRGHDALWFADGLSVVATGRHIVLATTQLPQPLDEREPIRRAGLQQLIADAGVIGRGAQVDGPFPSLYPERPRGEYAWGMSIDLNACIGCNVCTIACQAENNIPVVGAEQVEKGRVMHWIRVDRYEDEHSGASLSQPVPCMHCEHAPCELVCPVGATVHDSDGLNVQVYNRCVGTRFCANNCPYKVRRFNFLQFSDTRTESLKGQRNPEVTVRNRGVMEKCSYCIQRIRVAEIAAHKENRSIRDGEVRTACQSACPTQAIRFGDQQDAASEVARAKSSPLHYALLAQHNTRPRTTYLARLSNPSVALSAAPSSGAARHLFPEGEGTTASPLPPGQGQG